MAGDECEAALVRYLDARANGDRPPEESDLSGEDRTHFEELRETADLLWLAAHGAPPLESDPVAVMLGLYLPPADPGSSSPQP